MLTCTTLKVLYPNTIVVLSSLPVLEISDAVMCGAAPQVISQAVLVPEHPKVATSRQYWTVLLAPTDAASPPVSPWT